MSFSRAMRTMPSTLKKYGATSSSAMIVSSFSICSFSLRSVSGARSRRTKRLVGRLVGAHLAREFVGELGQREAARLGDSTAPRDGRGHVGEALDHRLRRAQMGLGVGLERAARFVEGDAL